MNLPNNPLPSIPPRGVTWPMVGYALVRDLPSLALNVGGAVIAALLVVRSPSSAIEPIAAVLFPGIITALAKSKPSEPLDVSKLTGGPPP